MKADGLEEALKCVLHAGSLDEAREIANQALGYTDTVNIYALRRHGQYFYVGMTKRSLEKRLAEHRRTGAQRIQDKLEDNEVEIVLLEKVSVKIGAEREIYWYDQLSSDEHVLLQRRPDDPSVRADRADPQHGTLSRYTSKRLRCRCDLCRNAMREYRQRHSDRVTNAKETKSLSSAILQSDG